MVVLLNSMTSLSTENDISRRLAKAWTTIDRLSIIKQSNLFDKIKRIFFPSVVVSIRIYGCTTWTMTKRTEKKQVGNCTRMLRAILKNAECNIRQNSCCTSTYLPSLKQSKKDEQDTQDNVANQTRRQVKNLTIILPNPKQNVQTVVLMI